MMAANPVDAARQGIGVLPLGVGLTATLVLGYVLCWVGEAASVSASFSHAWLGIFSTAPAGSMQQLIDGVIWSLVASWFSALVFAPIYNLMNVAWRRP
jgi:hypothetical protein